MKTNTTTGTGAIELTIMHVRADGPVTRDGIAYWLHDQLVGCDTLEQARREADKAIKHGIGTGWLALYDGIPGEYVMGE